MSRIYTAIAAVMADMPAIGKDRTNTGQGFKYRSIDQFMNTLQPLLVKHKLFILPSYVSHETTFFDSVKETQSGRSTSRTCRAVVKGQFSIVADDGSKVVMEALGEGLDQGDKATAKAMSVAFKYAIMQAFCIPTEDIEEADAESPSYPEPAPRGHYGVENAKPVASKSSSKKEF